MSRKRKSDVSLCDTSDFHRSVLLTHIEGHPLYFEAVFPYRVVDVGVADVDHAGRACQCIALPGWRVEYCFPETFVPKSVILTRRSSDFAYLLSLLHEGGERNLIPLAALPKDAAAFRETLWVLTHQGG